MYILGNKFNSRPQQVEKNREDIEELKKNISANEIYNANIEISTDASVITTDDIKNWNDSIKNGYVLDTVGNLFKIVAVEDGNVYIDYACTLPRGATGETGQDGQDGSDGVGIASIVAGTPIVGSTTTTTPLTITFTNGQTATVNVVAQNGSDGQTGQNGASVTNVTFALKPGTTDTYVATTTLSNGSTVNSGDIVLPGGGGGSTLFQHNITLYKYDYDNNIYNFYIIINIISTSSTAYTKSTIMNLLQSRSNSSASGDNLTCNGLVQFYDSNTQTVTGYIAQYLAADSNSGLVFLYYFDGTSLNSYTTFEDLTDFYVDDNVKTL